MAELTPDELDLLSRVNDKEVLRPFFFRKAKGLKWFRALDKEGYFSSAENPKPVTAKEEGYVTVPFWPATEYLVATSPELRAEENQVYAERVLNIMREATQYAIDNKFSNYRTWWQFSKIIQNIPPNLIATDDLLILDYWLDDPYERGLVAEGLGEHWLVNLLDKNDEHCNELARALLAAIYQVRFVDQPHGNSIRKEAVLRVDSWRAKQITEKAAPKAGQALGCQAVEIFRGTLEKILQTLNNDRWSSIWRSAVEDHEQNYGANDAEDVLVEGMRDTLLAFVSEEPIEAKTYIAELLAGQYETIKRIAIFVVDQRYQQLTDLEDKVLVGGHFTSNFRHEMWHLLRNHYPQFSVAGKEQVQRAIEEIIEYDEDGQKQAGGTAYRRANWLSAIHEYGQVENNLYQECIEIIGGEPEHPDFSSYSTSGWVRNESPISKEDLASKSVDALIRELASYKDTDHKNTGPLREVGLEGLVKALREVVKGAPERYYAELHKFMDLDFPYVDALIEAYSELWTEKKQLPWDEIWQHLLAFFEDLVRRDGFWSANNTQTRGGHVANRHWVVASIARLIENGTKSDEHAFSEDYLEQANSILKFLLDNEEGESFKPDSDAVSISINSPRGRCIEAFVNLGLRVCRLADKKMGDHIEAWNGLQPTFDAELDRSDADGYEFATLVVNYLSNFLYMSKGWVLGNLNRIFDQNNYQKWLCAMNGYAYVSTVYEGIYEHLSKNGHLIRALDDENLKDRVGDKIVQNIAIAYIHGFETVSGDNGLISSLLSRHKVRELGQLIWFIWTLRGSENKKLQGKVYDLWSRLVEVIHTDDLEGKRLVSKLCTWSAFVNVIDDVNRPLIMAVAPYVEYDYNSHDLLKMVARISEVQPNESYEIWRAMLEGTCSDYPEKAVRTALSNLIRSGAEGVRQAKDIVSIYLKAGNERPNLWLQELLAAGQDV